MKSALIKPTLSMAMLLIWSSLSFVALAQNNQLRGNLINSKTGQPISNARIEVAHGDKTYSDDYGAYSLNLAVGNRFQPGEELVVHIHHKKHGYFMERFVVPKSLSHNFSISPNTLKSFAGTVKDVDTDKPLKGMRVSFFSQQFADPSYRPPVLFTDESGFFRFIIDQKQVGQVDYAKLSVVDDKGCYETYDNIVNVNGDNKILLRDKCKPSREGGGDYKREVIPDCEPLNIGTLCVKNIGRMKVAVNYGKPQPGQNYVGPLGWSGGLWMDPGEEACFEELEAGRYLIKVNRGVSGQELHIPNSEKNYWKTIRACETIYVGCKLSTAR